MIHLSKLGLCLTLVSALTPTFSLAASSSPPPESTAAKNASSPASSTTKAPTPVTSAELTREMLQGTAPVLSGPTGPKMILVDFWASWCGPCRESLPFYASHEKDWAERGIKVLIMSADETREDGLRFLKETGTKFPSGWDRDRLLVKKLAIEGIPTLIAFDSNGNEVGRHNGFTQGSKKKLPKTIDGWLEKAKLNSSK